MTILEQKSLLNDWYIDNKALLESQQALASLIKKNETIENTIRELYLALFNKSVSGCGNCLADAFIELKHYPNEKIKEIMDCKFILKSGTLLMDAKGVLPMATAANLTDAIAISYLRDNIERKSMFEKLPDNLDELLNPASAPEKKTAKKTTKK